MTHAEQLELHLRRMIDAVAYLQPRAHRHLCDAKRLAEIGHQADAAQQYADTRQPQEDA